MARKKKGKAKKNNRKNARLEDVEVSKDPHTFVFARGNLGTNVQQLVMDMRKVMEPYTASNLKVRKKNILKDFVAVAGPLGVTHFVSFSKTNSGLNMRIARLPKGPTLYFKVHNYCLCKDIVSLLKKPKSSEGQYRHSPLLVLNDFKKDSDSTSKEIVNPHKLCATLLQNMFPSININKLNLNHVQRCVLFNYVADTNSIEFRHYNITVRPVGMSRRMKKLVVQSDMPNMNKCKDISDYLMNRGDGSASESELELDDPNNKVELSQKMVGKGNLKNCQSAIKLTELGPRMTLELFKIEEGMCQGEILYHSLVEKTEDEKEEIKTTREKKKQIKQMRKAQQEQNVKKKEELKTLNKKRSLLGMKRGHEDNDDEDDNARWYREEVGEEMERDVIHGNGPSRKKRKFIPHDRKQKKTTRGAKSPAHSTNQHKHNKGPRRKSFKSRK
ncbi:suppressor of SWI4 1 homolog [Clavelina lepadiformis]|uniref:Brix domain-containing protein n=1 Tax=Clavelina lepadiformis TaxID=159417 RepID=A0ABP0FQN6_CLALP